MRGPTSCEGYKATEQADMMKSVLAVFLAIWLVVAPGCCTIFQGALFKNPPAPYGGTMLCTVLIGISAAESDYYLAERAVTLPFLVVDWFLCFALDTAILPVSLVNAWVSDNVFEEDR